MKFLPKSKETKLSPLMSKYSAPSVLMRFSDIFSSLSCLFFLRGMEMISAPFMPMSLSSSLRTSRVLFCSRIAARQRAPSMPNEFLRIEPYSMPKLSVFTWVFLMSSSSMSESPTSLIILLAKLRCSILVLAIRFFTACIPYSEMELSARLSSVKLSGGRGTGETPGCWSASLSYSRPIASNLGLECAGTSWSLLCWDFP